MADGTHSTAALPFDELYSSPGIYRAHWQRYFSLIDDLGVTEAKLRWTKAKQLLQESGASYANPDDAHGASRPWRLSPIPLVIGSHDWRALAEGIAQRARLLAVLLEDLHGPQRVLGEGTIPCELVFDNSRFLRPLHGWGNQQQNWLPLYSLDLIRAPDGQFCVLADSTQAPAGMGYALENRIVVAHALSDILRHCNVERLAAFYRHFRDRLTASAPHNRDAPRIALMTPGPYSPTYSEQAYLAKYFGISLVQGEDLAVRDDRVFLKTLGGLQSIDVILRRVHDDYCDPLELRPESELGVPGLVQATRSGNLGIWNPLGTGLLETPALLAYLPRLCQRLLGEELLLRSVPTYYCGDPQQLTPVLEDFDAMVIKSTFGQARAESVFVQQLDFDQRARLRERVLASLGDFVAQKFVPASRAPTIVEGEVRTRAVVLRCFAHCIQRHDYAVMPGGLALVAPDEQELAVSMQRGARSKDVWIISQEPVTEGTLQPPANPAIEVSRAGGDLPSRVADNLFWLGRYTERAESLCRLARVVGARMLEFPEVTQAMRHPEQVRLLTALHLQVRCMRATDHRGDFALEPSRCEDEFVAAIIDRNLAGSVLSTLDSTLRVSRLVRDRISQDTWRILASLDDAAANLPRRDHADRVSSLINDLDQIVTILAGFSGLVMESMSRGFGWRFLDMGRRIERGIALVALLQSMLVDESERDPPLIEAVLDVADSGMTYRRRYPANLQVAPAVDLLVADETNPRSILFQLKTLAEHVSALPTPALRGIRTHQHRLILAASTRLELCDAVEVCRSDPASRRRNDLEALLVHLAQAFPALSDSLTETYLYHADVARQLRRDTTEPPARERVS